MAAISVYDYVRSESVRVIGVLDLSNGMAVHAKGGARAHYGPVQSIPGIRLTPGDALAIGSWFVKKCGLREVYIADLDALRGRPLQRALVSDLAALGASLWVDAGISSVVAAQAAQSAGASRIVVASETLSSFDALAAVCQAIGGKKVAFSLDIRRGEPYVKATAPHAAEKAETLVARAVSAGAGTIIVLDLSRVGTRRGVDVALLERVRAAVPDVELIVGGGVRGPSDLAALEKVGCNGALVATALYDGRLQPSDLVKP
jgi:phosphoribosylformimino-5-aminoimidazole carboxamide ribotide isomerase